MKMETMIKIDFKSQNVYKMFNNSSFNYRLIFIKNVNNLIIFKKTFDETTVEIDEVEKTLKFLQYSDNNYYFVKIYSSIYYKND